MAEHIIDKFTYGGETYVLQDNVSGYITSADAPGGGSTTTWYGTSSTTASTAAKVVTCADFALAKGAIVAILFSTANTAATPTLNINGTGAKSIYIGASTPNATTNVLKWSANTLIFVMYDGTYYRFLGAVAAGTVARPRGANIWYGTCSTSATTAAKTSTIANFILTTGATVVLQMTTANTIDNAAVTLNVNSTGAKTIYYENAATSATNTLLWDVGDILIFTYDGTYWRAFKNTDTTYSAATTITTGLMSAADKYKLDNLNGVHINETTNQVEYTWLNWEDEGDSEGWPGRAAATYSLALHLNATNGILDYVDLKKTTDGTNWIDLGGIKPDTTPIGTILDFAGTTAPTGYLICDGSAISRETYWELFGVIGDIWGAGDGSTTFNLPDLRGRTAIGAGTSTATDATNHTLGTIGGAETHYHTTQSHKLTASESGIPAHSHPLPNSAVVYNDSSTQRLATSGSGTKVSINTNVGLATAQNTAATAATAHTHGDTGNSSNMQPFATVNKIIKAY